MDELIRIENQYYILSTSSLADDRTRVLKHNETFAVFGRRGDIEPVGSGVQGLYDAETRFISRWILRIGGSRPALLSSTIRSDNAILAVDMTNPDVYQDGQLILARGALHIARIDFIWGRTLYEKLRLQNFSAGRIEASISIEFGCDFADIFEVRGMTRKNRGENESETPTRVGATLAYHGLDGVTRRSIIACTPTPDAVTTSEIKLRLDVAPKEQQSFVFTVSCDSGGRAAERETYETALARAAHSLEELSDLQPEIYTQNEQFNDWVNRSGADLRMLLTRTSSGLYPYAGVPWFSTAFGRDGLITAMEVLWANPSIARGVLAYLACTQATEVDPERDAEPGKILHETRSGEMAALKEIPFGRYYGSVDATPLFVMLAGGYFRRTADLAFIEQIWPNVESALNWMEHYGDADHDEFIEYSKQSPRGLTQQGWKDSQDSVFHSDGTLANGPIALCEVQGYAYAAKKRAADLATALGRGQLARELRAKARQLKQKFDRAFWCEELSTYALALDGDKRPCCIRASNAGHTLFTGIAAQERRLRLAQTLFEEDSFCGWGVRTLSSSEKRYSPMAYHNGSVWPHDNALIARGLSRYGLPNGVSKIMDGLLDASVFIEQHRLPELFCGFHKRPGEGPTLYPVACSPQAWASGAVFLILEACLGIVVRGNPPLILFRHAALPESLPAIQIRNLRVGKASVDLQINRADETFNVTVLRKRGDVEIVSVK